VALDRVTLAAGAILAITAACGDNLAPTVHVFAEGAQWMAVRPTPDAAWERHDGEDVRFETTDVFDVAVVCREDIGGGFSIHAAPIDGLAYTEYFCRRTGGVQPTLAITGRADAVFVGASASYLPSVVGQDIVPGTYDVVAQWLSDENTTERVQVLRGVRVDGITPIPIDVGQYGLPPAAAIVTVDGETPDYLDITGLTATRTWFRFFGRTNFVLPPELTRPTDRQTALVYHGDAWAEAPVYAGENDLALPPDTLDATFSTTLPFAVSWQSSATWERVTLSPSQSTSSGQGLPRWHVYAYASTFATAPRVELLVPDLADWQASWMPDPSRGHVVIATWERARVDGGRGGITKSVRRTSTSL
jgi:hypothetical protein